MGGPCTELLNMKVHESPKYGCMVCTQWQRADRLPGARCKLMPSCPSQWKGV